QDTLCISHKRCCDKIDSLLYSESDIIFVFLCDRREPYSYIRNINAFLFSKLSSVHHLTADLFICLGNNPQSDQTVVNKNRASSVHILRQPGISNGNFCLVTHDFLSGKSKGRSIFQDHFLSVFQLSGTDLRTFRIEKYRRIRMKLFPELLEQIHTALLLFVISVGKIKT